MPLSGEKLTLGCLLLFGFACKTAHSSAPICREPRNVRVIDVDGMPVENAWVWSEAHTYTKSFEGPRKVGTMSARRQTHADGIAPVCSAAAELGAEDSSVLQWLGHIRNASPHGVSPHSVQERFCVEVTGEKAACEEFAPRAVADLAGVTLRVER